MERLIGLDIGTSAVKGAVMTTDGTVLGTVTEPFTYFGEMYRRLIDPKHFLETCFAAIGKLAQMAGEGPVAAICFCHASGNLLLLDQEDQPLIPIIGWQTWVPPENLLKYFSEEEQQQFYFSSGWPLGPSFPVACLAGIKNLRPDLLERTKTVTMSGEYLNFALTGKWGITHSMGTPFFLMDQEKGVYNTFALERLGIADKQLPPIYDKGTVLGTVLPEIAAQLHVSADTKVVLGTFDHPSGALGAGVLEEGEMLLSCGTSWVELFPVASREFAISTRSLVDRFLLEGAPYCVMTSVPSVSEKIDALRKHYLGEISHEEFGRLAGSAPLGCHGLSFAFTDQDYQLEGTWEKSDIARAIIEGAAKMLKANLAYMRGCGLKADRIAFIGGITNSEACIQIIAEVLESKISVVNGQAAGAVGACLLAGIGIGLYQNEKDAFSKVQFPRREYSF